MLPEASYLRDTAQHLRGRAATAQQEVRAQLLALADYYDGMAEDCECPSPLGSEIRKDRLR